MKLTEPQVALLLRCTPADLTTGTLIPEKEVRASLRALVRAGWLTVEGAGVDVPKVEVHWTPRGLDFARTARLISPNGRAIDRGEAGIPYMTLRANRLLGQYAREVEKKIVREGRAAAAKAAPPPPVVEVRIPESDLPKARKLRNAENFAFPAPTRSETARIAEFLRGLGRRIEAGEDFATGPVGKDRDLPNQLDEAAAAVERLGVAPPPAAVVAVDALGVEAAQAACDAGAALGTALKLADAVATCLSMIVIAAERDGEGVHARRVSVSIGWLTKAREALTSYRAAVQP